MSFKILLTYIFISVLYSDTCPIGTLCYAETGRPTIERLDPYNVSISKIKDYEKRLFALMHETLYERSNSEPLGNFLVYPEQKISIYQYNNDNDNFFCELNMPDKFEAKWKFHDGSDIEAIDIVYSLKYAIHVGILPESLFSLNKIKVNIDGNNQYDDWENFEDCDLITNDAGRRVKLCESDNTWSNTMGNGKYDSNESFTDDRGNVEIGLKLPLSEKTLKAMLTKIYILPARIFKDYIDNLDVTGKRDDKIWKKTDINFQDELIGSGPYNFIKVPLGKFQPLDRFDSYFRKPKIKNIDIRYNALKSDIINDLEDKTINLAIDIPYPGSSFEGASSEFRIKEYSNNSLNLFLVNHQKPYLSNLILRKAIAYAINRENAQGQAFQGRSVSINSAATTSSSRYNPNVEGYDFSKRKMKKILKKLIENNNFKLEERRTGKKLFYKNNDQWEQIELIIIYNYNDSESEEIIALENIQQSLRDELGVKVKLRKVQRTNWKSKLRKPNQWDLAYDKIIIEEGESLDAYYASYGNINKKTTKYKNELVDRLIKEEKENLLSPLQAAQTGRQLIKVLSEDVASIFLWSLDSYCVYNKTYIHPENEMYINYYNFFTEPHNWRLIK
tara:strand:- start:118 stop:1965 length:1848 start_codon:yes stop_codon:yes gene_type:complete